MNLMGQQKLSNLRNREKKMRINMNTSSGTCGISKGPPFVSWSSRSREEVGKEKISTGNKNGKLPKCGDINF